MCNPPIKRRESPVPAIKPQYVSTASKAVLRPSGYRREHEFWKLAKDYWVTQHGTEKVVIPPALDACSSFILCICFI